MNRPTEDEAGTTREQMAQLGRLIERRREDILKRWLDLVSEEILETRMEPTALRDAMPDYLARLSAEMSEGKGFIASSEAAWTDTTREHGVTRVRQGFDVDQLVHEFVAFRRILMDVADEEGLDSFPRQLRNIADVVDAAIAIAVRSYVEFRDYQMRRREAEYIAFITHEVRNPLTVATMSESRIRRAKTPAELDRALEGLARSHARIRKLIDGMLLTEEVEARRVDARPLDVGLRQLVAQATAAAEESARLKGLRFRMDPLPDVLVRVDPELTSSALENLADNAVKYTDRGLVEVTAEEFESSITLHVRDECPGISPEELGVIFEPFRRGSTHRGKPGSGLGLAIARRAMRVQGSTIHAESDGERGCHFWFTVPKTPH